MTFSLLIIHNRDRMSSITRVLHITTWVYFTEHLAYRFIRSSRDVKGEIMTDINVLVQEFLTSSSHRTVGASILAMRRLLKILQNCFNSLGVCFNFVSFFCDCRPLS